MGSVTSRTAKHAGRDSSSVVRSVVVGGELVGGGGARRDRRLLASLLVNRLSPLKSHRLRSSLGQLKPFSIRTTSTVRRRAEVVRPVQCHHRS